MARDSGEARRWKLSMRLIGRGFLIVLAGFSISMLGMIPWLSVFVVVGYVVTLAGIAIGF